MMLRNLSSALLAVGMTLNLSMGLSVDRAGVGSDQASSIRGGAAAGCVNQGTPFTVCAPTTCNPNNIPPVPGQSTYNNNGSPTSAGYKPGSGTVYCPCGNTPYQITGTTNASCYTVNAE